MSSKRNIAITPQQKYNRSEKGKVVTREASAQFRRTEAGKKQRMEDTARRCRLQGWKVQRGARGGVNAVNRERCEARVVKFETAVVDARGCCGYLLRFCFQTASVRLELAELSAPRDSFNNRFPYPRCGTLFESTDNLVAHENPCAPIAIFSDVLRKHTCKDFVEKTSGASLIDVRAWKRCGVYVHHVCAGDRGEAEKMRMSLEQAAADVLYWGSSTRLFPEGRPREHLVNLRGKMKTPVGQKPKARYPGGSMFVRTRAELQRAGVDVGLTPTFAQLHGFGAETIEKTIQFAIKMGYGEALGLYAARLENKNLWRTVGESKTKQLYEETVDKLGAFGCQLLLLIEALSLVEPNLGNTISIIFGGESALSGNRLDLVSLADPLWNDVERDDDEAADVIVLDEEAADVIGLDDEVMTEAANAMEL